MIQIKQIFGYFGLRQIFRITLSGQFWIFSDSSNSFNYFQIFFDTFNRFLNYIMLYVYIINILIYSSIISDIEIQKPFGYLKVSVCLSVPFRFSSVPGFFLPKPDPNHIMSIYQAKEHNIFFSCEIIMKNQIKHLK